MFLKIFLGIIGSLILLKAYLVNRSRKCTNHVSLVGRTVMITGANTGIGFQSALEFAKRGARVILACRDKEKAEKARDEIIRRTENDNVVIKLVNLRSLQSVIDFTEDVLKSEERLDILVNNAGVGTVPNKKTDDGLEMLMQINYFGPFLLTMQLLGLMKKAPRSRIINVSSLMAKIAELNPRDLNSFPGRYGVYANSKLCNILFTQKLAEVLKGTNVTVFSLHPGAVKTDIFRKIKGWRKFILTFACYLYFKSSEEGAQTIIHTATEKDIEEFSGQHFEECEVSPPYPNAKNPKLAEDVWDETFKLLSLDQNNFL